MVATHCLLADLALLILCNGVHDCSGRLCVVRIGLCLCVCVCVEKSLGEQREPKKKKRSIRLFDCVGRATARTARLPAQRVNSRRLATRLTLSRSLQMV